MSPPTPSSSASAGKFVGTLALAVAALGLTAAMYVTNWRRARVGGADGGKVDANFNNPVAAGVGGGGGAGGEGSADGTGPNGGAVGNASATGPSGCALPQRNYYSIRAEMHVRRHNANLVEWGDEMLGIAIPFSPILFAVTREERQAPMILLSFQYLRQPSHEVAVAIEELCETQSAESYREASLNKILDCSSILSTSPIRIGNTSHPSAEYCYVDERDQMHFVMAIFVTHEKLALTIQYSASTRVRNLLPTAFYELVRSIRFSQPRPTPSYLLVSEPRLGLGFRLALDFMVHEGLVEGVEGVGMPPGAGLPGAGSASSGATDVGASPCNNSSSITYSYGNNRGSSAMRGATAGPAPGSLGHLDSPRDAVALTANYSTNSSNSSAAGFHGSAIFSSPFATAVGRGTRRMGLIACYEPSASAALNASAGGSGGIGASFGGPRGSSTGQTSASSGGGGGAAALPTSNPQWHQFLDRQMQLSLRWLGVQLSGPLRMVFREASGGGDAGKPPPPPEETVVPGQVVMRPYRLTLSNRGNFGGNDEDDYSDESGRSTVSLTGSCCVQEVRLDVNSPCLPLIRDSLDQLALEENDRSHRRQHDNLNRGSHASPTSPAYLGIFYIPIHDECVSFTFVASAQRHSFEEFVSWCSATMQSMSLRNHLGQGTSVLYCNVRHEILPFTLSLQPGMQAVEEPQLGDPLAVVSNYGVERTTVMLRAFPLLQALPTSSSGTGTPANTSAGQLPRPLAPASLPTHSNNPLTRVQWEKQRQRTQARVLEHMLRSYLGQLPESVRVLNWGRCTIHGRAAMRFCFEQFPPQLCAVGGGDGIGQGASAGSVAGNLDDLDGCSVATTEWLSSRSLVLEEEVGSLNPFSRYYPPAAPSLAYLGLRPPPPTPRPAQPTAAGKRAKEGATSSAKPTPPSANVVGSSHDDGGIASVGSQTGENSVDDPLRVGTAVCAEGHAFMFISSASVYSLAVTQLMVQELASHFDLNTSAAQ